MPPFDLSFGDVASIAAAAARAANLKAAFHTVESEIVRVMRTRATIFEKLEAGWVVVAGPGVSVPDVAAALSALSPSKSNLLRDPVGAPFTALSLTGPEGPPLAVLLEGDWSHADEVLSPWALMMSFVLQSVREHDLRRHTERLLIGGYAMSRRLSRLGTVDSVGQRIVKHVAGLLNAERVSVALYRPTEDCLTITAAFGYPLSAVEAVRIQPGSWVIGHVHSSGRPVFVRDVRLLPGMAGKRDQYRTFSFAAVPMLAGSEAVGVLTVTDKRDGSAFDRQDEMVLRTLSVIAGMALVAARTDTEVSRLAYAATFDALTGLLNRPYLDTRLHQEVERTKREANTLAVLMADIDEFKTINDTYGHQVGDTVLQAVGSVIRSAVRVFDVCARYGGDEFAILMPNSDLRSAIRCAERIRERIADYRGDEHAGIALPRVTMSIGVAVIKPGDKAPDLLLRADRCLYQAKADGKNQVCAQETVLTEREKGAAPLPIETAALNAPANLVAEHERRVVPYVLVADPDPDRAALYLESIQPFKIGLLIARDGDQAARLLERFGPPILLILDLSVSSKDGIPAVIETLRGEDRARTEIIAWSPSREVREFAAARLCGLNVRVLGRNTAPSIMRAAIKRALQHSTNPPLRSDPAATLTPEELHQAIADLSDRARQLSVLPGVAIYMKAPGTTQFSASFTWTSDDVLPHPPQCLPHVFDRILETGETLILTERAGDTFADGETSARDPVQGLVAVPVLDPDDQVIGAICVFDVKPLSVQDTEIVELQRLGCSACPARREAAERIERGRDRAGDHVSSREAKIAPMVEGAVDHVDVSIVDWPPTLLDRAGGEFAIARELARARRERRQLSVVMFNISPARTEPKGGLPPNDPLESVADTLVRAIRQSDLPIRWGGSELLLVLPGIAGAEARSVAERVRAALQAGSNHRVSVSGGVAELESEERFGAVVERARQKVGLALGRGHNRVI